MRKCLPDDSHNQHDKDIVHDVVSCPLKLLIVEDVAEDIELIVLTLKSSNLSFTYHTASLADQCRHLLSEHIYDVVLSDYRLPNLNGPQVFELVKESRQDAPFILITGSLGEEAAVEFIKAGMTDYVLKDRLFRLPTVLARALEEFELRRQQKMAIAKIKRQAWQESIINRIVQAMRQTLVLEDVLQTTVDQIHEALQVSRCSIFQSTPDHDQQSIVKYFSQVTSDRERLLGNTCALYNAYQDELMCDRPIVIHDFACLPASIQVIAQSNNIHSMILMPLLYQQSYLGGISLQQCDCQRTWTEDEVMLVKAIADQCAIAIHQAQLYQKAQTELIERQRIEAQLRHEAFHDALTGLPNRTLLMNRLEHAMQLANRRSSRNRFVPTFQFAVLFLDLDRFKVVNDSLGHAAGDQLLQIVAQRLTASLRMGDTVARLGGDEFVILLEDIQSATDAVEAVHRIHQELKTPIVIDGHEIFISASFGITFNANRYNEPNQLLRDADIAMYRSKRRSPGSYEIFDASMHTHAIRQLQLESDLQRAIERQEFSVHYQPIVALDSLRIQGFEALARWHHPEQGIISPSEFIPIAEDMGLIMSIDLWVLQEACRQLRVWQRDFPQFPYLSLSVNLSGKQFSNSKLIAQVDRVLNDYGVCGSQLKVEITEGVLIDNAMVATDIFKQLKERQIQICLDDFGTGYSSLSYLHRFPIDSLKIDRSFISSLGAGLEQSEIVVAIVSLALNLGLSVVAEGLETEQQLSYLQSIHCSAGQGYHFARPLESTAASELLRHSAIPLSGLYSS